jgi:hypothetical protein
MGVQEAAITRYKPPQPGREGHHEDYRNEHARDAVGHGLNRGLADLRTLHKPHYLRQRRVRADTGCL